jgi:hypothetical protein
MNLSLAAEYLWCYKDAVLIGFVLGMCFQYYLEREREYES